MGPDSNAFCALKGLWPMEGEDIPPHIVTAGRVTGGLGCAS